MAEEAYAMPRTTSIIHGSLFVADEEDFETHILTRPGDGAPEPFGAVSIGSVSLHPASPAQCWLLIDALKILADEWQSELLLAASMGKGYVPDPTRNRRRLTEEETPADHRSELHDDGLDGTEWDLLTPGDVTTA